MRRLSQKQTHAIREKNQAERNETPRTHFQALATTAHAPTRDSSPMAALRPEGNITRVDTPADEADILMTTEVPASTATRQDNAGTPKKKARHE